MPCYSPLDGFRSRVLNENGKRPIVFKMRDGLQDFPITVPCGQCVGCRMEVKRQWAMRCMHEAAMHEENCFITLTYDNDNLPLNGSLDKKAFPKFMKRLRKRYQSQRIRYYHSGEYGDRFGRAHYHALLFGFDFLDKFEVPNDKPYPAWRSDALEDIWGQGGCEIGAVNFESAAYCAKYVVAKIRGTKAADFYKVVTESGDVAQVEAPYSTMSRRPGIGMEWYKQFKDEMYAADSVVVRGKEMKPPRFYDGQFEIDQPERMRAVKRARLAGRNMDEERTSRLIARQIVAKAGIESHLS